MMAEIFFQSAPFIAGGDILPRFLPRKHFAYMKRWGLIKRYDE